MAELLNIANGKNKKSDISYLNDDIFLDYYSTFYNDMSSKELDSDFNRELRVLVQSMSKMNESERKAFLNVLSMVIGHYIEQKIDKELDFSFKKIFKL